MLAVEKVILIVLFLVILAISYFIIFGGKNMADQILLQNELRQCCGKFRVYNCTASPTIIVCNGNTLEGIRVKLGINAVQLNASCDCP